MDYSAFRHEVATMKQSELEMALAILEAEIDKRVSKGQIVVDDKNRNNPRKGLVDRLSDSFNFDVT